MRSPALRALTAAAALMPLLAAAPGAWAQTMPTGPSIYTCTVKGKKVNSDRYIPNCDGEQRELNSDGSLRRTVPPEMSPDERAEQEAKQAQEAREREARREARRNDLNLQQRFPNETAHNKAREAALDDARKGLKVSEARLAKLQQERKPLLDETEFYVGKPLPPKLKQQLEGNEAATEAQRSLILNQQAEIVRINALYDVQLERLRRLWGGAPAGSLGPLPTPAPAPASGVVLRRPAP